MRRVGQGSKWIRPEKRLAIYIRDGFQCMACGRDLRDAAPAEMGLDHLVCSSQGGSNGAENLVLTCRSCNSTRQDRPWREFYPGGAQERIERQIAKPLNIALAKAILAGEEVWGDR